MRESVSGNVGETRRAGDHVCTTPMPAAELQPRLRPRSRTAADQRVGVMRLYYTGASPENLKRARQHAPSHSHGYGWTPAKMTPHDAPYFLDNGAFTDHFDADAWVETVERALIEMPRSPDFLVLPDVYGAAEATIQRHREWLYDRSMGVGSGQCMRYWVLQPGLPIPEQFEAIEGCQGVFVGGTTRWKRAHAAEIVRLADEHDLRTHVGAPAARTVSYGPTGRVRLGRHDDRLSKPVLALPRPAGRSDRGDAADRARASCRTGVNRRVGVNGRR